MIHAMRGTSEFKDEQNGITAEYTFETKKGRDYFVGHIKKNGVVVSKLSGSYMGYIEFDGVRYWDVRRMRNFGIIEEPKEKCINSDWRNRSDTQALQAKDND